eukprot:2678000-Rhodomonas_salina.1
MLPVAMNDALMACISKVPLLGRLDPLQIEPASYDSASERLCATEVDVIATRRLPPRPLEDLHARVEAESHRLSSHAVSANLACALKPFPPCSSPVTDIECKPVPGAFGWLEWDKDVESCDQASVALPTRLPTVTMKPRLLPELETDRHCTTESAVHPEAEHAVSPSLGIPLRSSRPKGCPVTVTLMDAAPTFWRSRPEMRGCEYEMTRDMVEARSPTVTDADHVAAVPVETEQRRLESDIHSLFSHAVAVLDALALGRDLPYPLPKIDTSVGIAVNRFETWTTDADGISWENISEDVRACKPAVKTADLLDVMPRASMP